MSSCLSVDLSFPLEHAFWTKTLSIAIIGPDEQSRRLVASALRKSRRDEVFEFHSYPPKRGYLRAVMENPFHVLILELDSNLDLALELVEEVHGIPGAAILAYSKHTDSKLTLNCIDSGVLVYSIADGAAKISGAVDRLADAFFGEEQESVSSKPSTNSLTANNGYRRENNSHLLPAVLPEDFDDWDNASLPVKSPLLQGMAGLNSANGAQEFSETPVGFSGLQVWEPKHRVRSLDQDEMREADEVIFRMFRRNSEKAIEAAKPRGKKRSIAAISLAGIAFLAMSLIAWSRPALLTNISQAVQNYPQIKVMQGRVTQTGAYTKAPDTPAPLPGM